MKKITLLILTVLLNLGLVQAQSLESVTEQKFGFSSGEKEVMKLTFKDVNAKNLTTAIATYFKKNYKAKVSSIKKTDGEFAVSEFKATDIQQKPTSAIYKVQELDGNAILYIHYKSDGYVVSSSNTAEIFPAYKAMSEKIGAMAVSYSYADVIKLREKDLATQEKALALLVKGENKSADLVDKSKNEIKASESAIKTLESSIAKQKEIIVAKAKLVADKKTEMANLDVKSMEKDLKTIEGDSKKAAKEIEKVNSDIAKKKAAISKLEAEISTLEGSIQPINDRISANTEKIAGIQKQISEHNEDALKAQLKVLEKDSKDALNEEKKMVKSVEKEKSTIEKATAKIKDAEGAIAESKSTQMAKQTEIDKTKATLKTLAEKISKLK